MMKQNEALLYATMPEHKFLVKKTEGFIKWALGQVENPYVACSFGKDSSVMLHLVLKQCPSIKVICFVGKEYNILSNYDEIFAYWKDNFNINLDVIHFEQDSIFEINRMKDLSKSIISDAYFVGIRKEESKARLNSLKFQGSFFKKKSGEIRISPMSDWTFRNIYAYACQNEIKLLNTYETNGIEARTGTWLPNANMTSLTKAIQDVKNRSMNDYNKLLAIYPDLNELLYV